MRREKLSELETKLLHALQKFTPWGEIEFRRDVLLIEQARRWKRKKKGKE
jgi:hypothetical protein